MEPDTASQIALRVAAALTRTEQTKAATARAVGIPWTTFSRKINGHAEFTLSELVLIAEYLKVPVSTLVPQQFMAVA